MHKQFLYSFDQNIQGKFSYLPSHIERMSIHKINEIILVDSGLNSNMFNILYCNASTNQASVKLAIDFFRSKKIPYAFWIGFEEDPSWLEEELLSQGLATDEIEWGMVCDLDKPSFSTKPSNFDIRQVKDANGIQDIINVIHSILPMEEHSAIVSFYEQSTPILLSKGCSLSYFVGYDNHKPISLSSLYYHQETASIFDVIVAPEMRGNGLGKAMTLKAMLTAKEDGFKKCVLTATNDAKYLYEKLGFQDLKTLKVYTHSF